MRNFKKISAVVVAVAIMLTTFVPAFAAYTPVNGDKADVLHQLDLYAGTSTTTFDPSLDTKLTRGQGAVLLAKLFNMDSAAQALTDAEANAILADFEDADKVPDYAKKRLAYLVDNDIMSGSEDTKTGKLYVDSEKDLLGGQFATLLLKQLGFTVAEWTKSIEQLAAVEGAEDIDGYVSYNTESVLRDQAVGIMYGALTAMYEDESGSVIEKIVEAKPELREIAEEAGLISASLAVESVQATSVNTLKVTFSKPVDTADVSLAVTKGTSSVQATVAWNEDKTVATVTTTAKMTDGTYKVTAKSAADSSFTASGTAEVKSQYVAEIKLLNETALTGHGAIDGDRAYIYYDVLDQYGESLRSSTTIDWSFSAEKVSDNKTTGVLTLKRSDDKAFAYGEKIYVTGVYSKTGVTVTGTVSVGAAQALNSIEVAGYVKKGTTEIVKTLPTDFKANTYYLVYSVKDQNGNAMVSNKPVTNNEVTFISDNVMLVKELAAAGETTLTINGKEYNAVFVTPGMNVAKGGEVNITAIATKTGNKTVINTTVGEDQILTSFTMSSPTSMIADGESVEVPFEALDQNGEKITNFTTLAKQATFNKLTFTTSTGSLKLSENADGTATLKYTDNAVAWSDPQSTDGINRTVSLTSVVVGGNTSSQLVYIQDKARPDAISSVDMDNVLVEQGSTTVDLTKLTFLDQYGRTMEKADTIDEAGNGFFAASKTANTLKGNDFAGYDFIVRATFKGDAGYLTDGGTALAADDKVEISTEAGQQDLVLTAVANKVGSARSGFSIKYEIAKYNTATGSLAASQAISTDRTEAVTVVDINSVKGYTVTDLNKFYVKTVKSSDITGDSGARALTSATINNELVLADLGAATAADALPTTHEQTVEVKGTYNGETVKVPAVYLTVDADKLAATGATIDAVNLTTGQALKWSDLYDATSARYVRKDAADTIKVAVKDLDNGNALIDSVNKEVKISDATPVVTSIAGGDTWTVTPTNTKIDNATIKDRFVSDNGYKILDQYGVEIAATVSYKVSSIVANAAGYAENNFKVTGNDSGAAAIGGAERGDTFVLTLKAGNVTKDIQVTVGADTNANITGSTNNYLDTLINGAGNLEDQRIAGLN